MCHLFVCASPFALWVGKKKMFDPTALWETILGEIINWELELDDP